MISTYASLAICLAICTKLMFFMNAPRVHAPLIYNVAALLVTIYSGSQAIQHLAALNRPTSTGELIFNGILLAGVFIASFHLHKRIKYQWRTH